MGQSLILLKRTLNRANNQHIFTITNYNTAYTYELPPSQLALTQHDTYQKQLLDKSTYWAICRLSGYTINLTMTLTKSRDSA